MGFYNTSNIIPAGTVLNATVDSMAMQIFELSMYAMQIVVSGTPTGNFRLQASNDPYPNPQPSQTYPINWTDVANSTFNVTEAGNVMWTVQLPGYNYVRAVYTDTSGGTSTATVTSSTFNAKG